MPLRVRTGVCCICVLPAEGSDPPGPTVLGGALLFPEAQTGEGKKNGPPFALPVLPGKAEAFPVNMCKTGASRVVLSLNIHIACADSAYIFTETDTVSLSRMAPHRYPHPSCHFTYLISLIRSMCGSSYDLRKRHNRGVGMPV